MPNNAQSAAQVATVMADELPRPKLLAGPCVETRSPDCTEYLCVTCAIAASTNAVSRLGNCPPASSLMLTCRDCFAVLMSTVVPSFLSAVTLTRIPTAVTRQG